MKVLQINAICGNKSTGRTTIELAKALEDHGHAGYVAYGEGNTDYQKSYFIGNWLDHKIHALLSRIFGLQGYFSNMATKKLIKYIEAISPDVVHLRNLHGNFVNLPMLLKFLSNRDIATVITLHDCYFFTGKCFHYTTNQCYKWQFMCGECPYVDQGMPSWFFDRTHKLLTDKKRGFMSIPRLAVIGVSQWVTGEAEKSILKEAKIIETIYNWVDTKKFFPRLNDKKKELGIEHKFVILGVSTVWAESKGLNDFLQLSAMLSDQYVIVLVGKLQNKTHAKNIIHIPATHDINELAEYYSMADVFFTPSVEETFGKVIAEALACGTPAIVYDSTACSEVVGPGCGAVVGSHDLAAVYSAIQEIYNKNKRTYSQACVDFVNQNFEMTSNIEKYLHLYERLTKM